MITSWILYFTEGAAGGRGWLKSTGGVRGWLKSMDPTGGWEGLAEEHRRGEMGVGWGGCTCNVLCVGTSYPEVSNQVTYM